MDKTALAQEVAELFRLNGHSVETSVRIGHREIDVVARELQGIVRKTILIECADYADPVGVGKLQEDELKLASARKALGETAVLVHVSRRGYTQDAAGYALENGLEAVTLANLQANLINFSAYVATMERDRLRSVIMKEYQPTTAHFDQSKERLPAITFLNHWMDSRSNYLILLGDYGVGKSWLLRRYLYDLIDRYKANPQLSPLPFFIPLQRFTKAFDFQNLILKTFETYGLSGAHYDAFIYMLRRGQIVLLLDSFDEMAQHLTRTTIRENLTAIFSVAEGDARIIMTSRPNYFENRAERILLVDRYEIDQLHPLDRQELTKQGEVVSELRGKLAETRFARLDDLTTEQRTKLFAVVLEDKPAALTALTGLLRRFQSLANLSQRAVIARLLTTVAETLAAPDTLEAISGAALVPGELNEINQAKIFEIVVYNLLQRDQGIGTLSASDRLRFLKAFALYLQRKGSDFFADAQELRVIVRSVFSTRLQRTDTPEQELESIYRVCRRHSGLTTEGQFYDTSGMIDLPVAEDDLESRVGFSHNSLREYLVAVAITDILAHNAPEERQDVIGLALSDQIYQFVTESSVYDSTIMPTLQTRYGEFVDSRLTEVLFGLLYYIYKKAHDVKVFGSPPRFANVDLSLVDLSGANLDGAEITGCLLQETDLSSTSLRRAIFNKSIIERSKFDDANMANANFADASVMSIFVYDEFDTQTTGILSGHAAAQWLFSHGAKVSNEHELNPFLGQPWYQAAREVTKTLGRRIAGTHDQYALAKGTTLKYRPFANDFVGFLMDAGVLQKVMKSSRTDGWVVKLNPDCRTEVAEFSESGRIGETLAPFFKKRMERS